MSLSSNLVEIHLLILEILDANSLAKFIQKDIK